MMSVAGAAPGATVHRSSLADQVARLIGQYMDDHHLAVGDPLPAAKELAERFDVSVPVVREAIAQLAGQGRLQRAQGRPTVARTPSAIDLQVILRSAARFADDRDRQLLQFRRALQVGAIRTVTTCDVPSGIAGLRDQLADWEGLPATADQLRRSSVALHRRIFELAGNDLALLALDAIDALLTEVDAATWQRRLDGPDPVSRAVDELAAVLAAVAAGKPRRAERLMHDHLDQQDQFASTR